MILQSIFLSLVVFAGTDPKGTPPSAKTAILQRCGSSLYTLCNMWSTLCARAPAPFEGIAGATALVNPGIEGTTVDHKTQVFHGLPQISETPQGFTVVIRDLLVGGGGGPEYQSSIYYCDIPSGMTTADFDLKKKNVHLTIWAQFGHTRDPMQRYALELYHKLPVPAGGPHWDVSPSPIPSFNSLDCHPPDKNDEARVATFFEEAFARVDPKVAKSPIGPGCRFFCTDIAACEKDLIAIGETELAKRFKLRWTEISCAAPTAAPKPKSGGFKKTTTE